MDQFSKPSQILLVVIVKIIMFPSWVIGKLSNKKKESSGDE